MHNQTSKYAQPRSSGRGTQLNRASFLLYYGVGLLALWVSGSPWSRVNGLFFGNNNFWQIFGLGFLVSLFMPLALVAIAAARGRAMGDPGLFRLPVLALLVSSIPFFFGLLSRSSGGGKSASAGLPMSIALTLGLLFAFFPYILHIVCCIRGAKEDNFELK